MNQSVRLAVADGAALYAGPDIAPYVARERTAAKERGLPIAIRGLRKSFGDNEVLRGVDLDIAPGEFVAIVGRSGCGKSTLLRLIAGLDTASGGSLALGDGAAENRAALRVMFQEPRLLPWARVRANVEVGLGRTGGASPLAGEALSHVGLAEKAGQWPAQLSGGQRQRVALARALVSRPRVLLFDEPLGALDALTRIHMQHLLEKVWREQGFTAILVTHDVAEAVALADRVIVLEDGLVTDDFRVALPRPRERGDAEAARLEGAILRRLLGSNDE